MELLSTLQGPHKENHDEEAAMAMSERPDTTEGPFLPPGYRAVFHLPNKYRFIIRVADAVALSSGGNDTNRSDLELLTPDRRVVRRVDLTTLATMATDRFSRRGSQRGALRLPGYLGQRAPRHRVAAGGATA